MTATQAAEIDHDAEAVTWFSGMYAFNGGVTTGKKGMNVVGSGSFDPGKKGVFKGSYLNLMQ